MTDTVEKGKLSARAKLLYGVGDVGNAMVNAAILFFLLIFYTDGALIAPALAGGALMVGKIWDAVNDPLFGWISDRTTSRFGKRRAWMIFGALPLAVSIVLLWRVPQGLPDVAVFVWIVATFVFYDTMNTLTSVPYYALTAELTEDYDERASLTAYRMVLGVPAYLVGAALTPFLVGFFATKRTGYSAVGVLYAILAAGVLWISAAGIKERKKISESKAQTPPVRAFLTTFRNRPFLRLIVAYLIAAVAFALMQTLLAYYLTYQLDMEAQVPLVMGLLLITIGLFLFPWKMLAERWNKGPTYALGLGIAGVAVASSFLLPQGPTPWIYVIAIVAGIGLSAQWVFPWAMVPDVVEIDRLETGEHRGGMFYGVWGFASKLTAALGIAVAGAALQIAGYVPNVAQTKGTLLAIRVFFGPVPLVILLIALPLLIWYPITRESHAELLKKLEEMEA